MLFLYIYCEMNFKVLSIAIFAIKSKFTSPSVNGAINLVLVYTIIKFIALFLNLNLLLYIVLKAKVVKI